MKYKNKILIAATLLIILPIGAITFYLLRAKALVIIPLGIENYHRTFSLATGDMNNDSIDDLIIASPADGNLFIYFGPVSMQSITLINDFDVLIKPKKRVYVGASLTNNSMLIKDINGDNRNELILGDPLNGSLYIIANLKFLKKDGGHHVLNLEDISVELTAGKESGIGFSMGVGHINSDGLPVLVVAAPLVNKGRGKVYILSALKIQELMEGGYKNGELQDVVDYMLEGDHEGDHFGWAINLANLNADRYDDIIISARRAEHHKGKVYIIFGNKLPRERGLFDKSIIGITKGDDIGRVLSTTDVDQDGYEDILIGSTHAKCNNGEIKPDERDKKAGEKGGCGEVYLLYNQFLQKKGENLSIGDDDSVLFYGSDKGDRFGWLILTGDFNGDKKSDFVIAAKFAGGRDNSLQKAGELYFVDGNYIPKRDTGRSNFHYSKIIYGEENNGNLGLSGSVGDINGDGFDDLIISSITRYRIFWKRGKVNIYYGGKDFLRKWKGFSNDEHG